jgi:hypothetical protein
MNSSRKPGDWDDESQWWPLMDAAFGVAITVGDIVTLKPVRRFWSRYVPKRIPRFPSF